MKRIMIWLLVVCAATVSRAGSEDTQRAPSFDEFSDWNHRHPGEDVNVDLYKRSWRDSDIHAGHGGFIEQEVLFPGDPLDPPRPGAVLKYIKAYNHGSLHAGCATKETVHENEQVLFYVLKGNGIVEAGGKNAEVREGSGIFIPARLKYRFVNTEDKPLDALIIVEDIPAGFVPQREMVVGNYHDSQPVIGWHWSHIDREVIRGAKFANPISMCVTTINGLDMAQPHVVHEGAECVWYMLEGDSLLMFGNVLRVLSEGEAFLIPPNGKVPTSTINHTKEPVKLLYFGNRHDEKR
ncbi:cupin domain-containing protein [bacterium]|nr:cupin domain-containing protein [bacterium]